MISFLVYKKKKMSFQGFRSSEILVLSWLGLDYEHFEVLRF